MFVLGFLVEHAPRNSKIRCFRVSCQASTLTNIIPWNTWLFNKLTNEGIWSRGHATQHGWKVLELESPKNFQDHASFRMNLPTFEVITVDGCEIHFAPPKKPWFLMSPQRKYQATIVSYGFPVVRNGFRNHPQDPLLQIPAFFQNIFGKTCCFLFYGKYHLF